MGRKSSAKSQNHTVNKDASGTATGNSKGPSPLIIGAIIVALVGVGLLAFWRPADDSSAATAATNATANQSVDPRVEARAASLAVAATQASALGRTQAIMRRSRW